MEEKRNERLNALNGMLSTNINETSTQPIYHFQWYSLCEERRRENKNDAKNSISIQSATKQSTLWYTHTQHHITKKRAHTASERAKEIQRKVPRKAIRKLITFIFIWTFSVFTKRKNVCIENKGEKIKIQMKRLFYVPVYMHIIASSKLCLEFTT